MDDEEISISIYLIHNLTQCTRLGRCRCSRNLQVVHIRRCSGMDYLHNLEM